MDWHTLEWIGAAVGLVYLWLEYRASVWLWLASVVMPAIYIFVYYEAGFYADMAINAYYLVASGYGLTVWLTKGSREKPMPITRTPKRQILPLAAVAMGAFALIAWILIKFTDSTVPIGDSFTTALSIVALWMLARKYVEQWLVWIVVDVICAGLYFYKGLYPTAGLFTLYSVIAVAGYYKWKKIMATQANNEATI